MSSPAAQRARSSSPASSLGSGRSASSGGGTSPPDYGLLAVQSLNAVTRQAQRAQIAIAVFAYLAFLFSKNADAGELIFGIDPTKIEPFQKYHMLLLCFLFAHLAEMMVRACRLARMVGDDIEFALITNSKVLLNTTVVTEPQEDLLLEKRRSLWGRTYYALRILERFFSYIIFLAIVLVSIWIIAANLADFWRSGLQEVENSIIFAACCVLLALALLRLLQFWVLRAQTIGTRAADIEVEQPLPFPKKYSITSIAYYAVSFVAFVILYFAVRPIARIVFCRTKKDYEDRKAVEEMLRQRPIGRRNRIERTRWQEFLFFLWD